MKLVKKLSLALVATSLVGSLAMAEDNDDIYNDMQMGKISAGMENTKEESIKRLTQIRGNLQAISKRVEKRANVSAVSKSELRSAVNMLTATIMDAKNMVGDSDATYEQLTAAVDRAEEILVKANALTKTR